MHPTRRQRAILEAVRDALARTGRAPTLAEIARRCGLASPAGVHKHLRRLEERGLLRRARGRSGRLDLRPEALGGRAVEVPLLGTIAAGRPIEAVATEERIAVPRALLGRGRTYVLRVRGDSMRGEQILDGDDVVVEERSTARDGETVVALLGGREATLKTLRLRGRRAWLIPANPAMKPIVVRPGDLRIQGVVRGLVRRFA